MAEVDTSFYKDAVAENPLATAGKVIEYKNKLLGNIQGQQAIEQGDQQIQSNSIKLATERFGMINNAASGLLSNPKLGKEDITKDLTSTLGRLTADDAMTAQHAVQFMQQFPKDPAAQKQAILDVHNQTLNAWEKGKAHIGELQGVPTGGGTKFVRAPAFGGAPSEQGYQPNTLPPTTPQYGTNNKQTYVGGSGNAPLEIPGNNLQPAPAAPQAPNRLGVMPPAHGAPARPMVPSTNKVMGDAEGINSGIYEKPASFAQRFHPPGSIVAEPPPGSKEAQSAQAQDSQKVGSALTARADTVPQRMADLNNMERELEIAGGKFGPLAHSEKKANQIAQRVLGFGVTMSPEEVAGMENFDKIGNQIALNQAGALGVTDQRVRTSMGANPNSDYSYLGNKGILPILKGNEDAIALKAREWKKYSKSHGADSYNDFSDEFNQGFNPQVFQFARMTSDQRHKFVAALPDKEQAVQLAKDLDAYKKKGWVKPNGDEVKK